MIHNIVINRNNFLGSQVIIEKNVTILIRDSQIEPQKYMYTYLCILIFECKNIECAYIDIVQEFNIV